MNLQSFALLFYVSISAIIVYIKRENKADDRLYVTVGRVPGTFKPLQLGQSDHFFDGGGVFL